MSDSRRRFLRVAGAVGPAALVAGGATKAAEKAGVMAPTPAEYLMRQHGIVHRVALVFDEVANRLENGQEIPDAFLETRELVFEFTEDYHEELEESFVFPHFATGTLGQLASVLRMQHSLGNTLAQRIYSRAENGPDPGSKRRRSLSQSCRTYSRMYRAHAGFEDTDLWPALRGAVSEQKYDDIRKRFHEKVRKQLGDAGFSAVVERLADVEERLGIEGLSDFTPEELP